MTTVDGQEATHRELITYLIERPIVVFTASIERFESGADAPRNGVFSDEMTTEESNDGLKV